jgi:hypothetical protein
MICNSENTIDTSDTCVYGTYMLYIACMHDRDQLPDALLRMRESVSLVAVSFPVLRRKARVTVN